MAGRANPPGEVPSGDGDDDEFRSTVFDESFINAARLREYSAQERLDEHDRAVADVPPHERRTREVDQAAERAVAETTAAATYQRRRRLSGQFLGLVLVILLAFGAAIYMGARGPRQPLPTASPEIPLSSTVVPLIPRYVVPGADPAELLSQSPADGFAAGRDALTLPEARATDHFTSGQVRAALGIAQNYVLASAMNPEVLEGKTGQPVRELLSPGQYSQFDRSLDAPSADGRFASTGWMVRFDPKEAVLAQPEVRARGALEVEETDSGALEISARHVFVYTLRAADATEGARASLFTARREVELRFTQQEIRMGQLTVVQAMLQAGPMPCAAATHDWLRPLLAGESSDEDGSAGTDPYATEGSSTALCGVLARDARPALED